MSLSTPAVLAQTIEAGIQLGDGSTFLTDRPFNSTRFGVGVDFNQAGTQLAVGSDTLGFNGGAFVFELDGSNLSAAPDVSVFLENGTVLGDGSTLVTRSDRFGGDVALTGDGGILAAGVAGFDGPQDDRQSSGAVFLFDLESNMSGPVLAQQLAAASAARTLPSNLDEFGRAVAFNSSGSRLAVGAGSSGFGDDFGEVFLFEISTTDSNAAPALAQVITNGVTSAHRLGMKF